MLNKTKINALALAAALVLSACGGGDEEKGETQPEPPAPPPTASVTQLPKDTFIMTAVDGDTFRLVIDRESRTAQIIPLNTMYGVEEIQRIPVKIDETNLGITVYSTANSNSEEGGPRFEIFTSPEGNEIVGQVSVSSLNSNVIGTNLQLNRTQELPIQGAYNGISMEADSRNDPRVLLDFGIKVENQSLSFCENGFYANNTCTGVERAAKFSSIWRGMATLQVSFGGVYRDYAYLLLAQNGSKYSLILDRLRNDKGRLVFGTGYAVPADEYRLNSDSKMFACIKQDASGGSYLSMRKDNTYTQEHYDGKLNHLGSASGALDFNRAVVGHNVVNAMGLVSFIEGATTGLPTNPTKRYTRGLAFSKNMMVVADEKSQSLAVCRSDSLGAKK
ncbi:hypothetical protein DZC30_18750 [Comamonas testosteroni]|uniref:Lipoprotein n=1 Tax=Comamonas testosteroni TaxID=285 RepID=A0A373FD66_COMTE|nr:hypothetical protein [Comamonas testosteroni]RGE41349.1 hypothetical protein DZC30_18750 [Comamonas testosteroni]